MTTEQAKREYFAITGYWKDTNENFEDYIVTNFDDVGNQDRFRAVAFDRATGNAVDATISWNARGS